MKMKSKLSGTLITITVLLALAILLPTCRSDTSLTYQLLNHPDGSTQYSLNIAISQSLLDYYVGKSHNLNSNNDLAKFVTPYALKPISDRLSEIYTDDEDFTNGALMIVHQIPYEVTAPPKFPVETMADNKGDCDLFSFIAASILKASGIDVVLLYYESEAHMNIGVSLSHAPRDARAQTHYVTYNNIRYYVAECTGGNWQTGWRVGENPASLQQASAQVITLENSEQIAPGQVSASYQTLEPSSITIVASSTFLIQGTTVALSGQLSPTLQDKTIVIYLRTSSSQWTALSTVTTDASGKFSYTWNPTESGIFYVRVGWSGDTNHAGADSRIETITVLSTFFVLLLGVVVVAACAGLAVFLMSRQSKSALQEPLPPEIPQ
jgi:hypothetical protein